MKNQRSIKYMAGFSGAVVTLLMVVAVIAATPAIGGNKLSTLHGSATLTAVGDEPGASGTANLDGSTTLVGSGGDLALHCSGLTPNANYLVGPTRLANPGGVANKMGGLKLSSTFKSYGLPQTIMVYRVEAAGNVLVLSGAITWQ
jgi:hypothetical protein